MRTWCPRPRTTLELARRAGVLAILAASGAVAADPGGGAGGLPDGPPWRLERAEAVAGASPLAVEHGERVLAWTQDGGTLEAAGRVVLLVEAPFAAVDEAVARALAGLGRFEVSRSETKLAYQAERWDEVLLSRRPELREGLARRVVEAPLREAEDAGLLAPAEVERRLAEARASTDSAPQDRAELPELQRPYASARYTLARTFRLFRSRAWELEVLAFDVSATFGRPATAVALGRADTFPNPGYSLLRSFTHWNVLSPGPPPSLSAPAVPADVFEALQRAAVGAAGGAGPRVAPSALWWALPVPPPPSPPSPRPVDPAAEGPAAPRLDLRWDSLTGMEDANRYPRELAALADGTLLLSAEVLAGEWSTRVWRLRPDAGTATQVWQGGDGASRVAVTPSGDGAWFLGSAARGAPQRLLRWEAGGGEVRSYQPTLDGQPLELDQLEWALDGRGLPAFVAHAYGTTGRHEALYQRLVAAGPPPAGGGRWDYRVGTSSAREAWLGGRLGPVRWAGPEALWTEDERGLAELDPASARTRRAIPLPRRFGGPGDALRGRAQWVPAPLGSPEAGWIAVGFVATRPERPGREVGMQVVDLAREEVRFGARLGAADTLAAAARSAGGRLLALGAGAGAGARVGLWEVAGAVSPLRLEAPERGEVHALAFAWDGRTLWALGDRVLSGWALPAALQDGARAGRWPEQSRY